MPEILSGIDEPAEIRGLPGVVDDHVKNVPAAVGSPEVPRQRLGVERQLTVEQIAPNGSPGLGKHLSPGPRVYGVVRQRSIDAEDRQGLPKGTEVGLSDP